MNVYSTCSLGLSGCCADIDWFGLMTTLWGYSVLSLVCRWEAEAWRGGGIGEEFCWAGNKHSNITQGNLYWYRADDQTVIHKVLIVVCGELAVNVSAQSRHINPDIQKGWEEKGFFFLWGEGLVVVWFKRIKLMPQINSSYPSPVMFQGRDGNFRSHLKILRIYQGIVPNCHYRLPCSFVQAINAIYCWRLLCSFNKANSFICYCRMPCLSTFLSSSLGCWSWRDERESSPDVEDLAGGKEPPWPTTHTFQTPRTYCVKQ